MRNLFPNECFTGWHILRLLVDAMVRWDEKVRTASTSSYWQAAFKWPGQILDYGVASFCWPHRDWHSLRR
jgi:hypothetical protein